MSQIEATRTRIKAIRRPRIGFLGVGWIGRHRMNAIIEAGDVEAAAIADPADQMRSDAGQLAPAAQTVASFEELLACDLDGVVIATPSALHAEQSIRALQRGLAVFCQKPLGRTRREVEDVVDAARKADRLLAVDLSYRFTDGMRKIKQLIEEGQLGTIFAADLVFHNAYGPDKDWFYDKARSGGGCVTDLGVHLADLALWCIDFPQVNKVESKIFSGGRPLAAGSKTVEDYAVATLHLKSGAVVRLTCSWRLQAGRDAIIEARFHGTEGGAELRNVDGSFYDFTAAYHQGNHSETLSLPPDAWGGRAAQDWAKRLAAGSHYDPQCERLIEVAALIDDIYAASEHAAG